MLEPLAGWTVGVTADRRAAEQVAMLERRGASVRCGPVIRTFPLDAEAGLRATTADLVSRPPDLLVATTAIGIRSWFASAWTWGAGERLPGCLGEARILARGPKAAAAVTGEGLGVAWKAPGETMRSVLDHLLAQPLAGRRVAVQLPGRPQPWFTAALRAAGAEVVEVAVYSATLPADGGPAHRLIDALLAGELDAVTLTTPQALTNLLDIAGPRRE
ncbi:MAG TPA: uroporphyrinogen-III synthase, partial [Acidimicrobiales bacterium]